MPKKFERSKLFSGLKQEPGIGALEGNVEQIASGNTFEFVLAAADEIVNNSAALQSDDELFFSVRADEVWDVELVVKYTATTAADFAWQLAVPGTGGTVEGVVHRLGTGAAAGADDSLAWGDFTTSTSSGALAAGVAAGLHVRALVTVGDADGLVRFQWAQAVAAASDATRRAGSYISARKVS